MSQIVSIAKEAKVSIATVSRVVNNMPGVREDLRKRVQEVINKTGFKPRIVSNRAMNIAVVIHTDGSIIATWLAAVMTGIANYTFEQGVDTTLMFLPVHRVGTEDILEKIRWRHCDGGILLDPHVYDRDQLTCLGQSGVPIMLVDSRMEIDGTGYVDNDSFEGSRSAIEHLIELGHRRIGFLRSVTCEDHEQRLDGYLKAMTAANLPINKAWIIPHAERPASESGFVQVKQLLEMDKTITAIAATNDDMAYGAIRACVSLGYRVPEDISVIGFDDYPASCYYNPPLSTVRQPMVKLGYLAAKYTHTFAKGALDRLPREVLKTELMVRGSTAKVNPDRV